MKKKLTDSKGLTLVEVLIAVLILTVFVSMAAVGTSGLFGTGEQMMNVSKAAVLGSDIMKIITNEVRFSEELSVDDTGRLIFTGTTYGKDCIMQVDSDGDYKGQLVIVKEKTTTTDGESVTAVDRRFLPISTVAYREVWIETLTFTIEDETDNKGKPTGRTFVNVTLAITDGAKTLWQNESTIVPLSQKNA